MKNQNQERLRRQMKQYHRHHPWRLGQCGVFVPHVYPDNRALTWWDDVGFILNGRRVMVWLVHPRMKVADAIEDMAWAEAGDSPLSATNLFELSEKQWKKVGRSRKKVVAYSSPPTPDVQRDYYAKLNAIQQRLQSEGVDLVVRPSMSVKTLSWCTGIELCIPFEVRNENDALSLAALAKQLLKREIALDDIFPGYRYGREDWLLEASLRNKSQREAN
ncbi:MAG: hypothetical protein PHE17_21240 [Thiothrix sp.]|uniref:hypothetical protein n=1 Tax=Thiothrix sp. TaxID=1032 RepID=UPI002623C443|nr:hypothetical protein [Thiothrix sp.]MDD5395556.1 hypothetical protein [Thiothrix sp.]